MIEKDQTQIAGALKTALISPNEPDRDGEPSNIAMGCSRLGARSTG
jgi:hypothetical protein